MTSQVLFIGTFISSTSGSKGPSESISEKLSEMGHLVGTVSGKKSPIVRFLDTTFHIINRSYSIAFVDVYSSRTLYLTYFYTLLLRLKGIPYISILHGGALEEKYDTIHNFLNPLLLRSKHIITPSVFLQSFFTKKGFEVQHLPNPLNQDLFPYKERSGIPSMNVKLLWVRAFSEIYQPELAIYTLLHLRQRGYKASLTMVGPDKGKLKECQFLAEKNQLLPFISFTGPVDNSKLYTYYHTHDILLNTTKYESFGMAVAEAASCGLPVVSNAVGEIKAAWKHEHDIILANENDFADKVSLLIENSKLYTKISQEAYHHAKLFYRDNIIPQWLKLIHTISKKTA